MLQNRVGPSVDSGALDGPGDVTNSSSPILRLLWRTVATIHLMPRVTPHGENPTGTRLFVGASKGE